MPKKCEFCGTHIDIGKDEYANVYLNPRARMLSFHVPCLDVALLFGRFKEGKYVKWEEKEVQA